MGHFTYSIEECFQNATMLEMCKAAMRSTQCWPLIPIEHYGWEPTAIQVLLIFCYAVIAVYLFDVGLAGSRSAVRHARVWRMSTLQEFAAGLRAARSKRTKTVNPFEQEVLRVLNSRRVARFRSFASACRHFLAIILILQIGMLNLRWNEPGQIEDAFYGEEFTTVLLLFCAFMCAAHFPRLVVPRTIDALHVLVVINLFKHLYFFKSREEFLYRHEWVTVIRLALGVSIGNVAIGIPLNLMFTLCDMTLYQNAVHESDRSMFETDFDYNIAYFFREAVAFSILSVLIYLVDQGAKGEIRASLEAMRQKHTTHTVSQILSSLCDAVVHLTADLNIKHSSEKLAGLLLQPSSKALESASFVGLLHELDREGFIAYALAGSSLAYQGLTEEPARPLHVHMRDANRSYFAVELFLSSFQDLDGQITHLVGVLDCGDTEQRILATQETVRLSGEVSTGIARAINDACGCCDSPIRDGVFDTVRELTVSVDSTDNDLPLRKASRRLDALINQPCLNLRGHIKDADGLLRWLQKEAINAMYVSGQAESEAEVVFMRRRQADHAPEKEIHTRCKIDSKKKLANFDELAGTVSLTFIIVDPQYHLKYRRRGAGQHGETQLHSGEVALNSARRSPRIAEGDGKVTL